MKLDPDSAVLLTDMKLSEIQHLLVSIHEEANGSIFLDALHNLEWTALALAGEAGELANKVKKIRRDGNTITENTTEARLRLEGLRREAADIGVYAIVVATLLGLSLTEYLDMACDGAEQFAESKNIDLAGIATRGGPLFKYVVPFRPGFAEALRQAEEEEPVDSDHNPLAPRHDA